MFIHIISLRVPPSPSEGAPPTETSKAPTAKAPNEGEANSLKRFGVIHFAVVTATVADLITFIFIVVALDVFLDAASNALVITFTVVFVHMIIIVISVMIFIVPELAITVPANVIMFSFSFA